MADVIVPSRTCTTCGDAKPATNEYFARQKTGRYGLAARCKLCSKATTIAWREANPGRAAEMSAAYRKANPEKVRASDAARNALRRDYCRQKSAKWHAAHPERARAGGIAWRAANPERVREYRKKYRAENGEKISLYLAHWYARNREKAIAYSAARRASDRDRDRANAIAWYANNKERAKAYRREWRIANPDKRRIYSQNRRARKLVGGGKLSPGLASKLFTLQKGRCACCSARLHAYHLDHIVPLALGGKHEDSNMQLLTPRCNSRKGAKSPIAFAKMLGRLI